MKKYLMTGVAAVALCAAFTSCSKSGDDLYNPEAINQNEASKIVKTYEEAFIKTFGQPAADQDWGFGSSASTRSAETNSNQWGTEEGGGKYKDVLKKSEIPAITAQELANVRAVFDQKGEASYTSLIDWSTFFVQQVFKGTASYTAGNGGTVIGGNQMDWLCAYDPKTKGDDHVNNFNNANGSVMLMMNSSTSRFGYKSSTDNGHVFYYFRMEQINGMYYVGFDFSAEGQNSNEQVQRDYIYNDWIVKIVPGQGYSTVVDSDVCIIAEDLSATSATDFDFNDVVFEVKYTSETSAQIQVRAAGGTLGLTVAGHEVHGLFGDAYATPDEKGLYKMINTGAKADVNGLTAQTFTVSGIDRSLRGQDIIIKVNKGTIDEPNWIELKANQGEPAAKLAVNSNFDYCSERESIKGKYPHFSEWVLNPKLIWY